MATGSQEIRFGVTAVNKGFLTTEQVADALALQVAEELSTGKHIPIGKILLGQGVINRSQLDQVLTAMEKPKKMVQDPREELTVDEETASYLGALKSINEELIQGLQTAISVLENVDKLPKEKCQSIIESLKRLLAKGQEAFNIAVKIGSGRRHWTK